MTATAAPAIDRFTVDSLRRQVASLEKRLTKANETIGGQQHIIKQLKAGRDDALTELNALKRSAF